MNVTVSYDLHRKHSEFKDVMYRKGYTDHFYAPEGRVDLPNTMLFKESTSTDQAYRDMEAAAKSVGTDLLRPIAQLMIDYTARLAQ